MMKNSKTEDIKYTRYAENKALALLFAALGGAIVFIYYYQYAIATLYSDNITDLSCHAEFAKEFYMGKEQFLKAWLRVPYMFWHLLVKTLESRMGFPLFEASAFVYALFGFLTYFITAYFIYKLVKYYTKNEALLTSSISALALSFVGPYMVWWKTTDLYYGQFSANPFHNPTHMAVKAFGLVCTMLGIDIIKKLKNEGTIFVNNTKYIYIWFGLFLFLSTLTKPTYMYMLLPAGALYLIGYLLYMSVKMRSWCINILKTFGMLILAALPSLVFLVFEFLAFYEWGEKTSASAVVLSAPLEVWHMFSFNVPYSVALGMFFPIWIVITNLKSFVKTTEGTLSLICYFVGALEFAFIKETGARTDAANFAWCLMAGMVVLFAFSVSKLLQRTYEDNKTNLHTCYIVFSWFLLFLHVYSGITLLKMYL